MKRLKCVLVLTICGVLATLLTCWTIAFVMPGDRMRMVPVTLVFVIEPMLYQHGFLYRSKMAARVESNSRRLDNKDPKPNTRELQTKFRRSFPAWSVAADIESVDEPLGRYDQEHVFGWPFLAMSAHWSANQIPGGGGNMPPPPFVLKLERGIEVPSRWTQWLPFRSPSQTGVFGRPVVHALPTRVLPLGFAANTFSYAALLYVLLSTGRFCRCRLRRRRGRCSSCAYDLRGGGHDKCPECGIVVSSND